MTGTLWHSGHLVIRKKSRFITVQQRLCVNLNSAASIWPLWWGFLKELKSEIAKYPRITINYHTETCTEHFFFCSVLRVNYSLFAVDFKVAHNIKCDQLNVTQLVWLKISDSDKRQGCRSWMMLVNPSQLSIYVLILCNSWILVCFCCHTPNVYKTDTGSYNRIDLSSCLKVLLNW